ncbi:MAG TPA: hypothetical protein VK581_09205 [Chthoniobacterales bacterium]|nr:hypothetical protein [Chthoniobacterales bacterium]
MNPTPDNEFPKRKRPAAGVYEQSNKPILVFATVCTKGRRGWLANAAVHQLLQVAWTEAGDWLVGRYVIMPDHLHFFAAPSFECRSSFSAWMQFWKSQFTKQFREALSASSREGEAPAEPPPRHLWQGGHWDRRLRSGESYDAKWAYVVNNPVRHGLVKHAADWLFQGEIHRLRF